MDEDKSLLQAYPIHQVQFEGEDLMKTHQASSYPSQLGRTLRKTLFGIDGLVDEMMNSEGSYTRSEASTEKTLLFEGNCFHELLKINLIVKSNINRTFNSKKKQNAELRDVRFSFFLFLYPSLFRCCKAEVPTYTPPAIEEGKGLCKSSRERKAKLTEKSRKPGA